MQHGETRSQIYLAMTNGAWICVLLQQLTVRCSKNYSPSLLRTSTQTPNLRGLNYHLSTGPRKTPNADGGLSGL